MANVVKKYTISHELAQKMVSAAVAKAKELGVAENVTILDDGSNLKAFSRMDGAPLPVKTYALVEFDVLSDQMRTVSAVYGVLIGGGNDEGTPQPTAFLIDKDGEIRCVEQGSSIFKPAGALNACERLIEPRIIQ